MFAMCRSSGILSLPLFHSFSCSYPKTEKRDNKTNQYSRQTVQWPSLSDKGHPLEVIGTVIDFLSFLVSMGALDL